jgi:putative Mg2+ transporter-C (MgtC) family protein
MSIFAIHFSQPFNFTWLQQGAVASGAVGRLLFACLLGGAVGLQRELKQKAAGVRTNLLICMGAALFTLLSAVLAGDANPDKGRVASNIVQGIGFLGAGLILHNRSRVSGLTSAASVWVVASIGMAAGAGLYVTAGIGTAIVIVALEFVGFAERRGNIKGFPLVYEARGRDPSEMLASILSAMDSAGERLGSVERDAIGGIERVSFSLTAKRKQHETILGKLASARSIEALHTFRDPEED